MFKLFKEVCDSVLQRSRLILCVGGREFVTDEVPEQAEVSSFFFRRLMIFRPHVLARCCCPQPRIELGTKLSRGLSVTIEARAVRPTELPILEAIIAIIRHCDVSATPHQITF